MSHLPPFDGLPALAHRESRPRASSPGFTRLARRVAALAVVAVVLGGCAIAIETSRTVDWTNRQRAAAHVPRLAWDPLLAACAEDWAHKLAASGGSLKHSSLDCWPQDATRLGENLANGSSLRAAYSAVLASPTHVANMLRPEWRRLGVGQARTSSGKVVVVWRFSN
jgi:uncharacterized protein YkwD